MRSVQTLAGVSVRLDERGRVISASDWARIDELVTLGLLRKVVGPAGTYGHIDYFVGDGPTWDVRARREYDGFYEHVGQVQAHDQNEARRLAVTFGIVTASRSYLVDRLA